VSYTKATKHRPHRLHVGHTFHSGTFAAPDIRATCCKCGGTCFVRSPEQVHAGGVTKRQCYGCVKEECDA